MTDSHRSISGSGRCAGQISSPHRRADACPIPLSPSNPSPGSPRGSAPARSARSRSTEARLDRIAALDGRLHAFIALTRERALAEARAAELALRGGQDLGPLHGIPYAAKDLYRRAGAPTTAGTRLLAGNVACEDAPSSAGWRARDGAPRQDHTVQFASAGSASNRDRARRTIRGTPRPTLPGGSSSGSAVAVAARARARWRSGATPAARSGSGGPVRHGRAEDHGRAHQPRRRLSALLHARLGWAPRADRRGRGPRLPGAPGR